MRKLKVVGAVIATAVCCSCSWFSPKAPPPPPAPPPQAAAPPVTVTPPAAEHQVERVKPVDAFRKDDLTFVITPDSQLNRYQNNAHTLFLCLYQLKDPNGFNQLIEEEGGIEKLLECRRFDATVANAKRLVIQPGKEVRETRDRAQGARFIGIVTGYYGRGNEKLTHLEPLPPAGSGDSPGAMIEIQLGPYEIESVTVN